MNALNTINQSPYVFYFLVVDNSLDIIIPQLKNFHLIYAQKSPEFMTLDLEKLPYFCLENSGSKIYPTNSGKLLSHPKVINYITKTAKNKKIVIIPFKPSAKIDFICRQNQWISASNSHKINRFLEDKIAFKKLSQKNNLPQIPSTADLFNKKNFLKYQKKYQKSLVIQSPFGWAGKGTFSSDNWDDIKDKIPLNSAVKFSPFLKGYSLLNNCCLTKKGLIQSPPALQYTGVKPFTQNPFTTVGRQWPSQAPKNIIEKINQITNDFSKTLFDLDYRGFFGLDFMVSDNQVYLLECNPRLTASFAFYHQMETNQGLTSLFIFHLLQFIETDFDFNLAQEQKRFYNQKIIGSEITAKNKSGKTIKKYHRFSIFSQKVDPIIFSPQIIEALND